MVGNLQSLPMKNVFDKTLLELVKLVKDTRRHFKYRVKLSGHFAPTVENQHDLLRWTVEPFVRKPYEDQLVLKSNLLKRYMTKVANGLRMTYPRQTFPPELQHQVENNDGLLCPLEPVVPSPITTQNRFKEDLSVGMGVDGREGIVGLFIGRFHKVIYCVNTDYLVTARDGHKQLAKAYENFIRQSSFAPINLSNQGHWKPMRLRSNQKGDTMVSISFHPQNLAQDAIAEAKKELSDYFLRGTGRDECHFTSLLFQECPYTRCSGSVAPFQPLFGTPYLHETVCGLDFRISPGAFFQINVPCAEVLFNKLREMADVSKDTVVLDVCCGTGTIGQTMARHVKEVIGIETCSEALEDAKHNAQLNGLDNTSYFCGRAEKVLKKLMKEDKLKVEKDVVAILNPGRAGFGTTVLNALRQCEAVRKIVYVSCKPFGYLSTNFVKLCQPPSEKVHGKSFNLRRTLPVDMFPQTRHCELILVFER